MVVSRAVFGPTLRDNVQPRRGVRSRCLTGLVSADAGAARQGKSAQEFVRRHGALAGALDLDEADRAFAAGDAELVVEELTGLPAAFVQACAQDLDALRLSARRRGFEPCPGKGREAADMIVNLGGRFGEIDLGFLLVDLGGVRRRPRGAGRESSLRESASLGSPSLRDARGRRTHLEVDHGNRRRRSQGGDVVVDRLRAVDPARAVPRRAGHARETCLVSVSRGASCAARSRERKKEISLLSLSTKEALRNQM